MRKLPNDSLDLTNSTPLGQLAPLEALLEMFRQLNGNFVRRDLGSEPSNDNARAVDEELFKVPADISTALLFLEPCVEFTGICSINIDFGEHRKVDGELGRGKLKNLGVGPRFLCTELVARKRENSESVRRVVVVKRTQSCVLRSEASKGRDVNDQTDAVAKRLEIHRFARDGIHREFVA